MEGGQTSPLSEYQPAVRATLHPSAASIQQSGEELNRLPPVEMEGIKGKVHTILGILETPPKTNLMFLPQNMDRGMRRH